MSESKAGFRAGLTFKRARAGMSVFRADGVKIPADPDNRDYREYLAWREAGNEPDDPDPLPPPSGAPSLVDRLVALEAADTQRAAKIAALEAEVSAVRGGREPVGGNDTL
jgi:hypothetical protein